MSQIFRRSNLPSWLGNPGAPAQAPQDPQVRAWMNSGALVKKEAGPVARVIEKALARKPETLDLSSAMPRLLEQLPVSLLLRLRGPTHTLVLAQDCPPSVALRLMHEVGARDLEPKSLMKAVEQAMSPRPVAQLLRTRPETSSIPAAPDRTSAASTNGHVPPRRDESIYDTPPSRPESIYDVPPRRQGKARDVPRHSTDGGYEAPGPLLVGPRDAAHRAGVASGRPGETDSDYVIADRASAADVAPEPIYANQPVTGRAALRQRELIEGLPMPSRLRVGAEDVETALRALRTLSTWARTHAGNEGQHPRCAMSAGDAEALARALRQVSAADLKAHERSSWMVATAALAKRPPRAGLHVTPETVRHLERALDAVRMLVAETSSASPALPRRSRGHGA